MPRSRALTAAAAAAFLCGAATAQITYTNIIALGQPAPGSMTGTFYGPQNPACQTAGKATVFCALANTGQPGFDNMGIWTAGAGGQTLVAIGAAPAPVAGRVWNFIGQPIQNRNSACLFAGGLDAPFNNDRGLFFSAGAGSQAAIREGDPAPGITGGFIGDIGIGGFSEYAINDSNQIAFIAPLTGVPVQTSRAIYAGDAVTGSYTLLARNGDPSPAPSGAPFSFITTPGINANGDVAFFSNLTAAPSSLFLKRPGQPLVAAFNVGDPAPGLGAGWTFTSLGGQNSGPPHFNNNREFVLTGGATNTSANSVGLWRGQPGALSLIAKQNDQAPGAQPNIHFLNFIPLINRRADVLFYANLDAGAQNAGIWMAPAGQAPQLVTLLNSQAPDMPPGTLLVSISAGGIGFNNRGEALMNASLNYLVNSTVANGIFAGRPGRFRKVVASGDSLTLSTGGSRTVGSILCWVYNSPDTGRETSINDRGEVAFSCSFVGGGGGTFLAQLPHPCPGDATGDDTVNFFDLNLVLSFFGMAVPPGTSGDLNGDGVVNFLDLNAVLSFFGGAC